MKALKVDGLSERLTDVLFNCGYSPCEIERLTGINHSAISQYLSGKITPSVYNLGVLAKLCGVTTDYLIYGE